MKTQVIKRRLYELAMTFVGMAEDAMEDGNKAESTSLLYAACAIKDFVDEMENDKKRSRRSKKS